MQYADCSVMCAVHCALCRDSFNVPYRQLPESSLVSNRGQREGILPIECSHSQRWHTPHPGGSAPLTSAPASSMQIRDHRQALRSLLHTGSLQDPILDHATRIACTLVRVALIYQHEAPTSTSGIVTHLHTVQSNPHIRRISRRSSTPISSQWLSHLPFEQADV